MPYKTSVSIYDRISWIIIFVVSVIFFLPSEVKLKISGPISYFALFPLRGIATLRSTAAFTRAENQRLSQLACELALENARLKSGSRLDSAITVHNLVLIPCQIIARDITTLQRFFIINRGLSHGVSIGAPCIAPQGIVGKVIEVAEHQSLIQTILEPNFRTPILNSRTKEVAIAYPGDNELLKLDYVKPDADFKIGDTIITAGLGGLFPKGLMVGIVIDIPEQPVGIFKPVIVQPSVNIARLETVYIINKNKAAGLPENNNHWLENLQPLQIKVPE